MRLIIKFIKRNFNYLFNIRYNYYFEPFVYIDTCGNVAKQGQITNTVRWMEKFHLLHWSEEDATKEAFQIMNNKHPELKGKIWLF